MSQKLGGILEFLVLDELPDQLPARILLIGVIFRRLLRLREQFATLDVHQIGRHDDELAGQLHVEHLEGVDVVEILLRDALNGHIINTDFIFLDEIQQQVEGALENLQLNFVIFVFHPLSYGQDASGCERKIISPPEAQHQGLSEPFVKPPFRWVSKKASDRNYLQAR